MNYLEILRTWDTQAEQRKSDFMEHMYHCAGRQNPSHPQHGLYTGLWQDFCIKEAGPFARDKYFDMQEAIHLYEAGQLQPSHPNEFTIAT